MTVQKASPFSSELHLFPAGAHLRIGKKGDEFPTGWGLLRGALFVSTGPLRGQVFSNREEFQCRTPTRARRLEAARLELRWAGLVPTGGFAPIPKGGEVAARALSAENGLHAGVQSAGR